LPKTASGKVKKYELREQLTGMRPAGPVRANSRARTEMEP
jgi:acyl-coenzyme A synthetase/AMP-(fatty) acid ligase